MTVPAPNPDRRGRHDAVSAFLADLDDAEIAAMPMSGAVRSPWSTAGTTEIAGHQVFIKRVPLTALEMNEPFSTRNHYDLPVFYQYGVGSAGFGAFRELAGCAKVTEWVLAGSADAFPILHHHRILPGRPGPWRGRLTPEQYVRYWGGSEAIGRYMQARGAAEHEMWMFFEHFPHVASDWVISHPEGIGETLDQLCGAAAALRDHGEVHFDAHLGNVVTDAKAAYLADFGLVADSSFELSQEELEFLGRHRFYDCGVIIAGLGLPVAMRAQKLDEPTRAEVDRRCGITESTSRGEVITALIDGADDIADLLGLTQDYLVTLARYRGVNQYMHRFIAQMQARNEKDVPYDDDEVRARLRDAGAPFVD